MNKSVVYESTDSTHGVGSKESEISLILKVMAILLVGGFGVLNNIFVIVLAVKYTVWKNLHYLIINMAVADSFVVLMKLLLGVLSLFRYNIWDHIQGKQQHIESAIKEFEKIRKAKISAKNVILMDDDIKNLEIARSCKMRTLHIIDDDSLDVLVDQQRISSNRLRSQGYFSGSE
ncbi:hypothetical protein QZH41_005343 [Actinostola sp. cb2023]|nr:hypothetical protein QZH41_005343 [Actinostola sp. cb2023]